MVNTYMEFFERDLDKFIAEIKLYKEEKDLWRTEGSIHNSAGNLALHLVGNLNHFVGAILGKTGYRRERDKEFSTKDVAQERLVEDLVQTRDMVLKVLSSITDEMMLANYPSEFIKGKEPVTTAYALTQLILHLDYHLGQVNYHRRLLTV
jgi:hypothetical protein